MANQQIERTPDAPGVYARIEDLIHLQYKARGFSFLPRQPVHSLLSGRYASRLRGRGLNFEEIRRYLPGDDIRTIDWKVTARTQKPSVRVYTEERDRSVLLVVDQRQSMFMGSRKNLNSVTAAEITALAAWRALSAGDRVGAVVFSDSETQEIRPHRSRRTVMRILGAVVAFNHRLHAGRGRAESGALNRVLDKVLQQVSHDYLVCLISTLYGTDEHTMSVVKRMSWHNDVIAALIYDPLQMKLPDNARFVVSDGDLQLELDTGDKPSMRAVSDFFQERIRRIKEDLNTVGVPVLLLNNYEDITSQIRTQLGSAARR